MNPNSHIQKPISVDILCLGHASYDLTFSVDHHPKEDEKAFANGFVGCGGGPAANAAVLAAKLGFKTAFSGYLGLDLYGDKHLQELHNHQIDTSLINRNQSPTPLSSIIVKPDGKRALINFKGDTSALPSDAIDYSQLQAKAILFDGHEPYLSDQLVKLARQKNIPTVLDAGSLHIGTERLKDQVDYLVCSEKFARQFAANVDTALSNLAKTSPNVVITLGEKGLIWQRGNETGRLPAHQIKTIDTTGAGDAFHGAFTCAIAKQLNWLDTLRYASAAGALCCTKTGARLGLPSLKEHQNLLQKEALTPDC